MSNQERHWTHDWQKFNHNQDQGERVCHTCNICTCHTPIDSAEPCEYYEPAGEEQ